MSKIIEVITPRTDAEWPVDHPLRKNAVVMTVNEALRINPGAFCVTTRKNDPRARIPAPPDDPDVDGVCSRCLTAVVHRKSKDPRLYLCCHQCWIEVKRG